MDPETLERLKVLQELVDKMNTLASDLEGRGAPLKLYNKDGSLNITNLNSLMSDEKYSEWRTANPEAIKQAQANIKAETSSTKLGAVAPIAGMALGAGQILQSGNEARKSRAPSLPKPQQRDLTLASEVQKAQVQADQGLSPVERGMLRDQIDRTYQTSIENAKIGAGGQASSFANQAQIAGLARNNAFGNVASMSEQVRRGNQSRLTDLLRMKMQEANQIYNNRFRRFGALQNRHSIKQEAIARLRDAGIRNTFGAGRSLIDNRVKAANLFAGDMPGAAYVNSSFDPSNPASAIFNNPLGNMKYDVPQFMGSPVEHLSNPFHDPSIIGPPDPMYLEDDLNLGPQQINLFE